MATKLSLYNGALSLLGETPLSSLAEQRPVRYWLDRAWDDGLINYCLEQGQWNWATRSTKITKSTSIIPAYGYSCAFEVPNDFMGMNSLWMDPFFKVALTEYYIEANIIYCEFDTIFLKYVSNAATYGGNLARWPETFTEYVQTRLAGKAQANVSNSLNIDATIENKEAKALATAKNRDKRDKPKDTLPIGNWTQARTNGANWLNYGGGPSNGY